MTVLGFFMKIARKVLSIWAGIYESANGHLVVMLIFLFIPNFLHLFYLIKWLTAYQLVACSFMRRKLSDCDLQEAGQDGEE